MGERERKRKSERYRSEGSAKPDNAKLAITQLTLLNGDTFLITSQNFI
jgi:hypothetical protein